VIRRRQQGRPRDGDRCTRSTSRRRSESRQADLVILAAPVKQNIELLADLDENHAAGRRHGRRQHEARDFDAARGLPARFTFRSADIRSAARGRAASSTRVPDLFTGRPWLLTPSTKKVTRSRSSRRLSALAPSLGGGCRRTRSAARLSQHFPQLTASALCTSLATPSAPRAVALGQGARGPTRLASEPAGIWRDITRPMRRDRLPSMS